MKKLFLALFTLGLGTLGAQTFDVAVFVPGVLAGSPIYEMMDAGVRKAAAENPKIKVKTIEGGFNQAGWQDQLAGLAASGEYELIVSSNPTMPEICDRISQDFPAQKFLVLEGYKAGNPQIATLFYNHRELAYLHGALAGLLGGPKVKTLGLVAGQEYPVMNNSIRPGLEEGFKSVVPQGKLEFRVVGNWYDASKALDLASSLYTGGAQVVVPIAGGANQGVLTAAGKQGKQVLWYDTDGYSQAKGLVWGSGVIFQDKAAKELVLQAAAGKLVYGTPRIVGVKEGYLDYLVDHPSFKALVPAGVQKAFLAIIQKLKSGALVLAPAVK